MLTVPKALCLSKSERESQNDSVPWNQQKLRNLAGTAVEARYSSKGKLIHFNYFSNWPAATRKGWNFKRRSLNGNEGFNAITFRLIEKATLVLIIDNNWTTKSNTAHRSKVIMCHFQLISIINRIDSHTKFGSSIVNMFWISS